ncbi:MAG: pyridoxal phosphate-dependent aminotransferase family protein [Endomicrobiaceae bacterium]|jgi:8-amino-7-oxononanoate synthase|nr:pyridoxal phosphate-dependent aminotransferase family protein [Endomicrobiaceae bacterium]MDD3730114.1 pyridoxal phosphate-dependent aminotransferase family protein [Endomicrobiaceae bacterium]MDD4165628.1 pyridoxal phosphate-dependent aminotransferase family protein [Endomicrobiaceae bacterium]
MNDIFKKCYEFTATKDIKAQGVYPYFKKVESAQGPEVIIGGRKIVVVCSNNYLGLADHPKVIEGSIKAAKKYGTSCTGSRFLNGTNDLHEKVEKKFAKFVGKETAILFTTGHHSNIGAISSLVGKNDIVITDKLDHASIIDGCRLALGEMVRFRHNDMADLERQLIKNKDASAIIVVDGVFSMEGDIANLPEIVKLAKRYGVRIFVDEAHSLGVLGERGTGTGEHFGLQSDVDVVMATASKSLASIGGFIASSNEVIEYIKHTARSLIFTASLPPACVGAIDVALDILQQEPERRETLWKNTRKMKEGFQSMGLDTGTSESPIIPITVGDDMKAFQMCRMLFDEGVFTSPVVSPAVPQAIIRTSYMATHTDAHLEFILDKFEKVSKQVGLIPGGNTRKSKTSAKKSWKFAFSRKDFADATKNWFKNLWSK